MYVRIEFENFPEANIPVHNKDEAQEVLDGLEEVFVRKELVSATLMVMCTYCKEYSPKNTMSESKGECPPCAADDSFHEDWRAECQ